MRHIIPISGKDSLATALLQTTIAPDLPYEFLFNDTGCELPPVYDWLRTVEQRTGWKIQQVGESLEAIIRGYNGYLPGQRSRYCTREAKIRPMEAWLGDSEAIIYYGLRADEQRTGYVPVAGSKIRPAYPLQDYGIDLQGVWSILDAQGLQPPSFHWPRLYDAVAVALSDFGGWEQAISRVEYLTLFSGRSRANCYFCFYQRQYEELWLLETYPDYFWRMAAFEVTKESRPKATRKSNQLTLLEVDPSSTVKSYTWRSDYSKAELASSDYWQRKIFGDRVKAVSSYIIGKIQRQALGLVADNDIASTSCGLLCGK